MGITEYAFATYVFILLCIGIWLFGRFTRAANMKSSKKQNDAHEKEQRLFKLYQNIEDLLAGFEEFTEEARTEAEKAKAEIMNLVDEAIRVCGAAQKDSETVNGIFSKAAAPETLPVITPASANARAVYKAVASIMPGVSEREGYKDKQAALDSEAEPDTENLPAAANGLSPIERLQLKIPDKVADMSAKGLDINDIARQLGISVREVSLAMKLRKVQ
ncbi:MAG: hypothetical protein WDA65_02300 [Christensenellales bacterium]